MDYSFSNKISTIADIYDLNDTLQRNNRLSTRTGTASLPTRKKSKCISANVKLALSGLVYP
jgi:hypothetical protein